jgi:CHAT domain-containing protein/tetratricopeptide (TPR) repeat protein
VGSALRHLPAVPLPSAVGADQLGTHRAACVLPARARAALYLLALLCLPAAPALPSADSSPPDPGLKASADSLGAASDQGLPTADDVRGMLRSSRFADAERTARALLRHVERRYGKESIEAAEILDLLASAMRRAGKVGDPETRDFCERAVRIKERILGPESLGTAKSLTELGLLFLNRGEFDESRRVLTRALDSRERLLGQKDTLVASSLKFLAVVESGAGRDSVAEPLLMRAIEIERAKRAPDDPVLGQSLNMLASLAFQQGDCARAGPLFEEVLDIYRAAYGPDDPKLSEPLHNLGAVYAELGDGTRALRYMEQALDLRVRTFGRDHWLVASTLGNIGNVLENLGEPDSARARFEEALEIQKRTLGADHPDVAWTLTRLGRLDLRAGRISDAYAHLTRAVDIITRRLGPRHPALSWTLQALAQVEERKGDFTAARRSFERAVAIPEEAYGPSHPDRILSLNSYAAFLARAGDSTRAFEMALRSADARIAQLRTITRGLAEQQALTYLGFGAPGLDLAIELAARGVDGPNGVRRAWDALIRSRTLVLDEMATRQRIVATSSGDSSLAATIRTVDEARRRYAGLLVRGVQGADVAAFRTSLDRAQASMERAERALAAASGPFRTEEARSRIGLDEVVAALPAGAGLVSFAVCDTGSAASYVAFVQPPYAPPALLPLGRTADIDAQIERWILGIASAPAKDRGAAARRAEVSSRRRGAVVRRKIWEPVAALLGPIARVFIVPEGEVYRVNLAALPMQSAEYLVETGPLLHVLTSERDLALVPSDQAEGTGLLALGGPSFDLVEAREGAVGLGRARVAGSTSPASTRGAGARGPLPACPDFRDVRFGPLPGSVREAKEIAAIWPDSASVLLLTGPNAGESELRRLAHGWRVIHLATHGFFLDGAHCVLAQGARGIGGLSTGGGEREQARARRPDAPGPSGHPLRLSGLALAGANLRDEAESSDRDGILTAEEVASLDLAGTEWVVLSACDTGVGRVQVGEGVLGLRRAFRIAGARTVVMSLWAVEDQTTRHWMGALYQARFGRRLGTAEAVRDADLSVLREQRAQARSTNPFFWAGFVASGDWR